MPMSTAPTIHYIDHKRLAQIICETPEKIAVVDVREADYTFGKISGSIHSPFYLLESNIDKLLNSCIGKEMIVFHCHYSQSRGPAAAQLALKKLKDVESHPTICVLQGGFKNWFQRYEHNPLLYEQLH